MRSGPPRPHRFDAAPQKAACYATSYAGRVALYDLMPIHGLGRILLDGSTGEIFDAAGLREDGARLSLAGVTTLEEVRRITGDRRLL